MLQDATVNAICIFLRTGWFIRINISEKKKKIILINVSPGISNLWKANFIHSSLKHQTNFLSAFSSDNPALSNQFRKISLLHLLEQFMRNRIFETFLIMKLGFNIVTLQYMHSCYISMCSTKVKGQCVLKIVVKNGWARFRLPNKITRIQWLFHIGIIIAWNQSFDIGNL